VTLCSVADVAGLLELYDRLGDDPYGEDVTQTAHALQCATHAEAAGASDAMVAAALLHDVGHLLVAGGASPRDADDHHESVGARALASMFGPAVAAPVALHVAAKRWRCATDPTYVDELSDASRASLVTQGDAMSSAVCERFEAHPAFRDAVALRGWDDLAKDPGASTGSIRDYRQLLDHLARERVG
jgi:phosphonate degradation associated HDIG domain protein